MGLLDDFLTQLQVTDEQKRAAKMQALAQAGFGMMGARKGQEGRAIGNAGLLGMSAYQSGLQNARQGNIDQFKMRQLAEQMEEQKRVQQGMQAATQSATTAPMGPPSPDGQMQPPGFDFQKYANAVAPFNPQASLTMLQQLQPKPADSPIAKLNPSDYDPAAWQEYVTTGRMGVLRKYQAPERPADEWEDVGKTPDGQMIQRNKKDKQLRAVGSPAARTTINLPPAESAFQGALGKNRAESFQALTKAGTEAGGKINQLMVMRELMNGIDTNALTPLGMRAASLSRAAGIDFDPKLPAKEAAAAISNKLTLEARSTAEGAGMPGAMSDADREFLRNAVPNLLQTPRGRDMLIEISLRVERRKQEIAKRARQYLAKRPMFDEGFADDIADLPPLFADLKSAAPSTGEGKQVKRTGRTSDGRRVVEYTDGTREIQ